MTYVISMIFQAWKMVLLNSMTFHDHGIPCLKVLSTMNVMSLQQ